MSRPLYLALTRQIAGITIGQFTLVDQMTIRYTENQPE
jgi:hypothetical protein